jgi:hypothetical protein
MATTRCRHCDRVMHLPSWEPHDGPKPVCDDCRALPVAERGCRQRGDDDNPTSSRCMHCLQIGQGNPCPQCQSLMSEQIQPTTNNRQPTTIPETEQARRDRLHAQRVAQVRANFIRGQRCLLARALDPTNQEWAKCEVRISLPKPKS